MILKLNAGNINSYLNDRAIKSFLEKELDQLSGKVLDIGCGRMQYKSLVLSNRNVTGYTGLDLESGKFSYSVKTDAYWDGQRMPFPDASFESAMLFEVLEHCADPRMVLDEAFRVLKPSGILIFSVPFLYQLHGVPFDYQRLTPFGAKHLLESSGFSNIKIEASGSFDASLGQMIGIWIAHRPMPRIVRRVLRRMFVPLFKILLRTDGDKKALNENSMITGILGLARRPR